MREDLNPIILLTCPDQPVGHNLNSLRNDGGVNHGVETKSKGSSNQILYKLGLEADLKKSEVTVDGPAVKSKSNQQSTAPNPKVWRQGPNFG